jgi:hypothetical protein
MPATAMLSFTVTRRGEPITFSTLHTLESGAEALANSRSAFAHDLRAALANGRLTRNQAPWLLLLAEEAAPTIAPAAKPAGEFLPLLEAVNRLQQQANEAADAKGRKAGKVTLRFVGAQVSAVLTGANTGCLYVKADGCYVGKITREGEFRRAYGVDEAPVLEALQAAQADPTGAAIAYGRETGACSCCGRELTNQQSIDLGIGPICLDKLGGAWL